MHRRRQVIGALVAVSFVAAACGDDDGGSTTTAAPTTAAPGSTTASTAAPTTAPAGPKHGGTLRIGYEAETDRFDPGNGNISIPARAVHHLVYGSLTAATPEGRWTPYLAESVTPNGMSYSRCTGRRGSLDPRGSHSSSAISSRVPLGQSWPASTSSRRLATK